MSQWLAKKHKNAAAEAYDSSNPIHIEDLEFEHDVLFDGEDNNNHRWLIATCVAGAVGSLIIGGTLLGFFGGDSDLSNKAIADIEPSEIWQRPAVSSKGDFKGQIAEAIALKPYKNTPSVVFKKSDNALETVQSSLFFRANVAADNSVQAEEAENEQDTAEPNVLEGTYDVNPVESANITTITKTPPPEPVDETIRLASGETLISALTKLGVTSDAAEALAASIEPVYPSKLMQVGQEFVVTLDKQQDFYGNDVIYPVQVSFKPGPGEEIIVEADEDGRFIARVDGAKKGVMSRYAAAPHYRAKAKISSSLYASARDNGLPDYIIAQVMRAFAYNVDFQRQINAGDEFDVFYGNPLSGSSKTRKVVHYAALNISGKTKVFYRFTPPGEPTGYYDENGRSATRALMRTPISGARISSGFGMRRHPILGYTKLHTGIDFAVPYGTPIRAAGEGVVKYARWRGSYGRTVIIDHGKGYKTLYAHMTRIATNLKPGQRIRQGQVIGYVGSTGRSTGPHLHYEVRLNGKAVNPKRVRLAGGTQLEGKALALFKRHKLKILAMMKDAPTSTRVAQADN